MLKNGRKRSKTKFWSIFDAFCYILQNFEIFAKIDFFGFCHPGPPGLASLAPTPHSPLAPRLASLACPIARSRPKNALKYTLGAFTMHFTSFGTLSEFSIFFGFQDPGARFARPPRLAPLAAPLVRTVLARFARKTRKFTIGAKKNIISKIRNGEASLFWALFQMKQ